MSGMCRKQNNFNKDIARAILVGRCRFPVTEETLTRFSEAPRVQAEIELFSQGFLAIWDHWNKEKGTDTIEAAKPVEDLANEGDQSDEDSESGINSSLAEKVLADGSLPARKSPPAKGAPHIPNLVKKPVKSMKIQQVEFRLANATKGREYHEKLRIEGPDSEKIQVISITGLSSDGGLEYDPEERSVKGNPTKPGEFPLLVTYRPDAVPEGEESQKGFMLIVNPDARELWEKTIPSDPNVPFWKRDDAHEGKASHAPWMFAAASKRGRSHARVGACRDDDFCFTSNAGGWHILAVSDGAGSAEFSREGARIAVECASNTLADKLNELGVQLEEAITKWQQDRVDEHEKVLKRSLYEAFGFAVLETVKKIEAFTMEQELAYRDCYATLLLCAHRTIGNEQFVAGYWIGDGALAVYAEDEYIKLLGESDGGEYAGQTRFLDRHAVSSGEEIMQRIRFDSRLNVSAVFLMTDGVSDPKFETDANLQSQEKWDDFWKEIKRRLRKDPERTSKNLLAWLGFWSPGNHDDRTLAVLYPKVAILSTMTSEG